MSGSGPSDIGTQRRLRALYARSWSPPALQRESGLPFTLTGRALVELDGITPQFARAVRDVYDRLWDQEAPRTTAEEEEAASEAQADAARRGWAPPQAWDDDMIDLPEGRPEEGWKPSRRTTKLAVDLVEDSDFVRQNDGYRLASARQVAMRLGVSQACLEQAYSRARRYAARPSDRDTGRETEAG
jgi:hypothetical protein